jgi:D-serine deaminase-like pyridoxal phosphate-dependent protein
VNVESLDTPVATVDLDAVERNIARMQGYCDEHGLAFRPHIKTHKLPAIAHMQLAAGAVGITCQKLGEAEVMERSGVADILLTYPLLGPA